MGKLNNLKQVFALELHRFGMFKDKSESPEGAGFRLRLHETEPNAPLSPYYLDLRALRSWPIKATAVCLFIEMMHGLNCDVIADVPTAITPVVSSLSDRVSIPMITPRLSPKNHGEGSNIDGHWPKGATSFLFDDVITKGYSSLGAVRVLRDNGIFVGHVFVLVDREQGGRERLKAEDLEVHSAFTVTELLKFYRDRGKISSSHYGEILAYRAAQV